MDECTKENPCESFVCTECCPHDEHDHGICLDCGADRYNSFIEKVDFND